MLKKNGALLGLLNRVYYIYRRSSWLLDFSRFFANFDQVPIDRPIFLLGTKGGGLTLISRMLRRNEHIVCVTGNCKYWSGADEMHIVLGPILPPALAGAKHNARTDQIFGTPRGWRYVGWLYASNLLIPDYRNTENDVTPEVRERFQRVLKWTTKRHSIDNRPVRLTDKSQIYTVKASFIAGLLEGHDPKFLLITRTPYAMCYRAASKGRALRRLEGLFDFEQRLEFAAQHWSNSMVCALEDRDKVKSFKIVRFEDVLRSPEKELKEICDFVELDYNEDMLPQPKHRIPFGSLRHDRWYPLRPEVNERYLREMKAEHVEIIAQRCERYADQFDYSKPKKRI